MKKWYVITSIILLVLFLFPLVGCNQASNNPIDGSYSSNGQRIYYTAASSSNKPITSEGYTMMMHRFACGDCHGSDGKGGTVYMMMQSFDVPDITWTHLTEEEHAENGEHEDHPPYTEETVKSAITDGLDPAGESLGNFMPRWQMSEQDLSDLVNYLKTLK